jgi:DNA-binding XRE family transcriptional regulator
VTGKEMQAARKKLGFSQRALGDAIGLHWNTIARMERDELPIMRQTELAVSYLVLVNKTKKRAKR